MGVDEITEKEFSIVTTTKAKYFGIATRNESHVVIDPAYEIPDGVKDPSGIAKGYIKGNLYGTNKKMELSNPLVESVQEAQDETRMLKTYMTLIPEAEKLAKGIMTYKAFEDLLNEKR